MISKERLEELINNQKTIYFVEQTYKRVESVELKFADIYHNNTKLIVSDNNKSVIWRLDFDSLFETEEDARWELEMTATRTETLRLPKWEEVQEMLKVDCNEYQIVEKYNIKLYLEGNRYFPMQIKLFVNYGTYCEKFNWNLSKENYIEACRMAKELFLGEEV